MYVAVASIGGVLYLRMVKGWKLGDMLYVTRAGLKQSVSHVTEGVQTPSSPTPTSIVLWPSFTHDQVNGF